ncbi:DDE-type integrase/transposase/recombinase [Duganella sp. FT80W]|uniref:DDE-type integrase/transposase/recombinase n=1 Tax=Duganella guangzhouensis TaxID=2666084 RepID=A0A6I2KW11_9BURK|nr:DDE-type integrase/transposase/recombinase [Duganella guangzhouensis]MRW90188.1 DDE-type integrase/transposase/recombinase [Duganella guangzhouensis]
MGVLIHNQLIQITSSELVGVFRVVFDFPSIGKTSLVRLSPPPPDQPERRGRAKSTSTSTRSKKPPPLPLVGTLLWANREDLLSLESAKLLVPIELERDQFNISEASKKLYEERVSAMAPFLDFDQLRSSILISGNIGSLVKAVVNVGALAAPTVYKLWSLMCRYGFTAESLMPRINRCGAPGKHRPCDVNGRQKAGRKTDRQRTARATGQNLPPSQPGMSTDWRARIMMADKKIACPKPKFPDRYTQIINSHFVTRFKDENGVLVPGEPTQGEYPNLDQVRRVLMTDVPRLKSLFESTTAGHFARSLRGLLFKNWKRVPGPGHTWGMDSTIGDVYLRSSINRAWIIGRPIVYVIVDYWSTAVVGFYVCLAGPSWDMAKLGLFSAAADPLLVADLWQYEPMQSLFPTPTLPVVVLTDRGEYLSLAAKLTSFQLKLLMSYTPPYRPDLKGLVEVLHRIKKDKQYHWVPGAIDARKKEFELRRFNPHEAVFTIREYVEYLQIIFAEYNLTADRSQRLDPHMIAAGVTPTPAGLWRWGHEVGIGTRRAFSQSDLITTLLPQNTARVTRSGVNFCGLTYESDAVSEAQWTAYARNFGGWNIEAHHFPGSVSRIWTPNMGKSGLLDLRLSEQARASKEQTLDEVLDAFMYRNASKADIEHATTLLKLAAAQRVAKLVAGAKEQTQNAVDKYDGESPPIAESRTMEQQQHSDTTAQPKTPDTSSDESDEAYVRMMRDVIAKATRGAT